MTKTAAISVNLASVRALAKQLKKCRPEASKQFQASIKEAAKVIAAEARERAGTFSTKIPKTVVTRAQGNVARITAGKGVFIGYAYEVGKTPAGNSWRHPVWPGPNRKTWFHPATWPKQTNPHRPYLAPALLAMRGKCEQITGDALVDAVLDVLSKT
jgi:hypothetical protein